MASVALTNGVNANLVRRWVLESDAAVNRPQLPNSTTKSLSVTPSFVPVQLPTTPTTPAPADIRIEVTRGATQVAVTWPATAASECAAWMRELLR
jgi:transposase